MTNKLVSILIVSHNCQNYITQTLQSCLNQTYTNFEVLILDNASTDSTLKAINKFSDPRIKLYKSPKNLGPYQGLNYLLDRAMGEYVAIQDHDDLWLPDKLQKQVDYLESHPDELACGTRTFVYYEAQKLLIADPRPAKVSYVHHISLMFRHQGFRYNPQFLLADEHFEKITLKGRTQKIACLPHILSLHRIRSDRRNLSRTRFHPTLHHLRQYFFLNGITPGSILALAGIFVSKYFPPSLEWFVIRYLVKRKSKLITLTQFRQQYPNLL